MFESVVVPLIFFFETIGFRKYVLSAVSCIEGLIENGMIKIRYEDAC